jgi:hypothetical protein
MKEELLIALPFLGGLLTLMLLSIGIGAGVLIGGANSKQADKDAIATERRQSEAAWATAEGLFKEVEPMCPNADKRALLWSIYIAVKLGLTQYAKRAEGS